MFLLSEKGGFKAEQRLVFGRSQSRHLRLFFTLPMSSSHTFIELVMIINQGMLQSFLFFNRLLLSRHSVSVLQLQFPPEV